MALPAESRPVWPMMVIAALVLALIGGAGFLYFNRQWAADPLADAISRAQQSVTDARARHPGEAHSQPS
jgi:hypothetical protein